MQPVAATLDTYGPDDRRRNASEPFQFDDGNAHANTGGQLDFQALRASIIVSGNREIASLRTRPDLSPARVR